MELDFIQEIAFYTGISESVIKDSIYESSHYVDYYKRTFVLKRNGEFRTVFVPSPNIKKIQHYLKEKYFSKYPISGYATAYINGKSVVDNALPHRKSKSFLFVDVHNFFNSIDFELLYQKMLPLNILDEESLRKALFVSSYKKEFVQGCVTSPILSNIYMYDFDLEIAELVKKLKNGVYTRYSDDITISSSEKIPMEILEEVRKRLSSLKLTINKSKTHFCSNIDNVRITGIRVKRNGTISLDTEFKKSLKTRIYHCLRGDNVSNETTMELIGLLSYLKMVDLKYYNIINAKYCLVGTPCISRLKKMLIND